MPEIPPCLNRRYQALDKLISELTQQQTHCIDPKCNQDPEIKLLCDFWNILKEDPDCDLPQAIHHRLSTESESGSMFGKQRFSCYMASTEENQAPQETEPPKESKPKESRHDEVKTEGDMKCCTSSRDTNQTPNDDDMPLSKVLCSLKEAASFDKRCHVRLNNLIENEKRLQDQIKYLEAKEKQGVEMLQQADCIWSCMEESYKQKIQESLERQKFLLKQLKDVEKSTTKWRKNKKDLESQLQSLVKCQEEIKDKINQKTNDIKTMNKEIEDFKKRIESNKKDSENSKKSLEGKKKVSDGKLANLANQIKKLQEELKKEQMFKDDKEAEGNLYIREAREDLQRICKLLLMKKLEHEDLKAEKQALTLEINLLKDNCGQCKERCQTKQTTLDREIAKIDKEIENYRIQCIQCHQCVDTSDVRKFCGDCPRCQEERECIYQDDQCTHDETTDCVCQVVKQKLLDNVFDNMYTVLERQAKTGPGKAVAEAVLDCLRRSRNGKLNPETRKILQEFILSTVKKNLNLTIVGGAVKTRCEMEPQMYEKLMACLKEVKPKRVPKADAGTDVKGEPCKRWGGPRECHCNKGPNACICNKKAPPPPKEPGPCPINKDDEEDRCPFHKDNLCGPECSTRAKGRGPCGGLPDPEDLGDLGQYIPDPCQGPSCPYTKDMRAAQCVFGPEPISSTQSFKTALSSYDPSGLDSQIICKCGGSPVKPCPCQDVRSRPRQKIIEEVLGGYDVMPIEKVSELDENWSTESVKGRKIFEGRSSSTKTSMNHSSSFDIKSPLFKDTKKQNSSNQLPERIALRLRNLSDIEKKGSVLDNRESGLVSNTNNKNVNSSSKDGNEKSLPLIRKNQELNSLLDGISSWNTLMANDFEKAVNFSRNVEKLDKRLLERKICDRVNKVIRSLIVTDETKKNEKAGANMEWISVKSFMNRITLACKSSDNSNVTQEETEVLHESLDLEDDRSQKLSDSVDGVKTTNICHYDTKNGNKNHDEVGGLKSINLSCKELENTVLIKEFLLAPKNSETDIYFDNLEVEFSKLYKVYQNLKEIKQKLENDNITDIKGLENIENEIKEFESAFERLSAMKEISRREKISKETEVNNLDTSNISDTDNYSKIIYPKIEVRKVYKGNITTEITSCNKQIPNKGRRLIATRNLGKQLELDKTNDCHSNRVGFRNGLAVKKDKFHGSPCPSAKYFYDKNQVTWTAEKAKPNLMNHGSKISQEKEKQICKTITFRLLERYSKQMKALLAQNPHLKSCWKEWNDVPHSGSVTPSFLKDEPTVQVKIKKVPSVLTDFISKSQQNFDIGTESLVEYRKKKKGKNFKKCGNKNDSNGKLEAYLTEIKNTCSGELFVELDHETITKIKKRANQNKNMSVSIKETDSGNYLIDFDTTDSTCKDNGKNTLKQSRSGVMSLEVDKHIVSNFYPYLRISHSKSSVSIGILEKKLPCDCSEEQLANNKSKLVSINKEKIESKNKNKVKSVDIKGPDIDKAKRSKSLDDYKAELRHNLGSMRPNITLKIQGENGGLGVTMAEVIETPSGNIALSVKKEDIESIGDIAMKCKELPVLLKKLSGSYTLYLQKKPLSKAPNTVLRRTSSGDFLVVITEPVLSNAHPKELSESTISEKIFKIKVKGPRDNSLIEPPAILKLTPSENYMLVLDKEFENEHRASLSHFDNQCFVELKKTKSNSILINLDASDSTHNKENALLLRSDSGNMKILVNGPVFDNLSLNLTNSKKLSTASQAIEKVLLQPNQTCKHKGQKSYQGRLADIKSSSDSTFYAKQNQSRNIDLNTATLKRTDSGKYAILLQNNAKKTFINNLKRYLSTRHQGHVPIWKGTENGELTIDLSSRENKEDQCGSLKITPSGNIFIIVDEIFINNVSNNMENADSKSTTESSQQYIMNNDFSFSPNRSSPVKDTVNKSDIKSSSHCDFYEKAKSRLQNQKGLLDGSAATVKKTDSGHYVVILNKESKKALINDLRSCLNNRPQDRIQFWKGSESGGITIDLSSNKKDNCGSLKISNSGNIYVIVNEKQLKNITKDIESNDTLSSVADVVLKNVFGCSPRRTSFADSKCNYLLKTVRNIENKQTFTNCKGKPDDDFCKRSKCVCSGNESKGTSTAIQKISKTTPHIVIQPCGCQSSKQKRKPNAQCYYVIDSVCPIHKDRYENVSNEILEISGTCKKTKRTKVKGKPKKVGTKSNKCINVNEEHNTEEDNLYWDSLSFLPPQLPPFLRNFQTA